MRAITGTTRVYGILADPIYHVKTPEVMNALFARAGVDGVLGLAAFRDLLATLDLAGGRLSLTKGSLPSPDGRSVLPLRRLGSLVGVDVRVCTSIPFVECVR